MTGSLKFRVFAHSWISDWNHGNAHFLRGLAEELRKLGHEVRCYEEEDAWSVRNLLEEGPEKASRAVQGFKSAFPHVDVRYYRNDSSFTAFANRELRDADVVIVHEWNDPQIVKTILSLKPSFGFAALFHDTHHRAYTDPSSIGRVPLSEFDGVLAFGEALRRIYLDAFAVRRAWTFHEAADIHHFHPLPLAKDTDVIWVGNCGDEERTRELEEFLIEPAKDLRERQFVVHGVRYPEDALARLAAAGIEYRGYSPNLEAPQSYARSRISLHVPRRYYANGLSGIPTIRMFEAMSCGSPLICSPWTDSEGLFRAGQDYITVKDGPSMTAEIRALLHDEKAQRQLARNGWETIQARHTCAHRAQELLGVCEELKA